MTKESSTQGRRTGWISPRTAASLAWSLGAVCVVIIALTLLLDYVTDDVPLPPDDWSRPSLGFTVPTELLLLTYLMVGALIASRLPTDPIGWIFCGVGLLYAVQRFTLAYADYALVENFAFPGGEYVAWFSSWVGCANLTLGVFLILLFPDGRLLSRRLRIVAWATLCGSALFALGVAFMPGQLTFTHAYIANPFGVVGVIAGRLQHIVSLVARLSSV